ncbi:hypothetical protein FNJ09_10650 [Salmonella enterica subsp. salamae]|nr:hypothetical protein [Salmonella enterica subsp. salamae]
MIRSGACIMGMLLFAASFSVNALTSNDFDPRDPAIWQEETATWEDEKSDIQRERERRDQRRLQNQYEKYSRRD